MAASIRDFLPFATAPGANVSTQAEWIADPVVPEGFVAGILPSPKTNKAIRQGAFVAAGVAEMMLTALNQDIRDDGNLGAFAAQLRDAIQAVAGGVGVVGEAPSNNAGYLRRNADWSPGLQLAGGTMLGALTLAADPTLALQPATKQYTDAGDAARVLKAGDVMTGTLTATQFRAGSATAPTGGYLAGDINGQRVLVNGVAVTAGGGLSDAASNSTYYGRFNASWQPVAPLASPTFTGVPIAPTATAGTSTGQIATTAFVATSFALLASPVFTGNPVAPTQTAGNNSTRLATTAFVAASFAPLAGPAFTGNPTATTQASADNSTRLATTAYVKSNVPALPMTVATGGTGATTLPLSADQTAAGHTAAVLQGAGTGAVAAHSYWGFWPPDPGLTSHIYTNAYPPGSPSVSMGRARGTAAAPAALAINDELASINFDGHDGTAWRYSKGSLWFAASEAWTTAAHGTEFRVDTTLAGTNTSATNMRLDGGGNLTIAGRLNAGPASYPGAPGAHSSAGITGALPVVVGGVFQSHPCWGGFAPLDAGLGAYVSSTSLTDACYIDFGKTLGTPAAPAAITAGTYIGTFTFEGMRLAPSTYGAGAEIDVVASENWNAGAAGAEFRFWTMTPGTLSFVQRLKIGPGIVVGSPTGGDKGGGTINASGVFSDNILLTSDARLKRDIEPLPERCLDLVAAIEPKMFRRVLPELPPPVERPGRRPGSDPVTIVADAGPLGFFERRNWGFIAQDIAEAMRAAGHDFGGHIESDDGIQSYSPTDMIAVLWQAVRELAAKVQHGA